MPRPKTPEPSPALIDFSALGPLIADPLHGQFTQTVQAASSYLADRQDQASRETLQAIATLGERLQGVDTRLDQLARQQEELARQSRNERVLGPLARNLIHFYAYLTDFIDDAALIDSLREHIAAIAGDARIELIVPEPGDPFDPALMKPRRSRGGDLDRLRVVQVHAIGARTEHAVLQHALVSLGAPGQWTERDRRPQRSNGGAALIACSDAPSIDRHA